MNHKGNEMKKTSII